MKKTMAVSTSTYLLAFLFGGSANAQNYQFIDLGTLGGKNSQASAINDLGQIVGTSDIFGTTGAHATLWSDGGVTDLGTLGGSSSEAVAINNAGQIAGNSQIAGDSETHAVLWTNRSSSDLGTLGGTNSYASAINNLGQVVGTAYTADNATYQATLWSNGTVTNLGASLNGHMTNDTPGPKYGPVTVPITNSVATGINDNGQVIGQVFGAAGNSIVVNWTQATPQLGLYTYHGTPSVETTNINNSGAAVGSLNGSWATFSANPNQQSSGTGPFYGLAKAINDAGTIVGYTMVNGVEHAAVWETGANFAFYDLNTALPQSAIQAGYVLESANGINNEGSIVGVALNTTTGTYGAFLLAAVPEPEWPALLLAGLCVVGRSASKRKKSQEL